ncbi:MAG TPA: hypothetical protein VHA74_02215, partial [Candidatus Dojkabacteria bacterium]|nr:hypothetical protein [Candidatus Dojkabacteria bacterium]
PAQAADLSQNLCCGLTISGKSNVYFDFESAADCSSCGACFPVGRQLNSGSILAVQQFKGIEGKTEGEQRKNCESKKMAAGSVYTSTTGGSSSAQTSSTSFSNGICNTTLKDSEFKVPSVSKDEFVKLANQLGAGNHAKDCYNYVVCNAKKDGINPAMALEVWLHESGASNYQMFPSVEDMGIHCYGGNSKYPPYPCNTTPKKNLAMQIGMFDALPHTMCLTNGKFDPVKWAAGFWTGSTCDQSYGQTYVTELKLYWSRIAGANTPFPTWIKDPSTAQPNLDCNKVATDGGSSSGSNGGTSGGNTGSTGNTDTGSDTTTQVTNTRICCAMILDGENQFRLDSEKFKNCTDVFPIGGNYHFKDQNKKINYVVQVNINDFNSCEGKVYNVSCQNGTAVPTGLLPVSDPAGTNTTTTKCVYVDPRKAIPDDGIIDIPAVADKPSSILSFIQKAYAADASLVTSVTNGQVTFSQDGLYDIKIRNYTVNNLPVNKDQKYRFYVNVNGEIGFQETDQLISFNKNELQVTRTDNVSRINVGAGSNLLNITFQPKLATKNINASSFMNYANVEGVKVIYITYFANGQWQKGLRARADGKPGYIGDDFVLKGNQGYLIISNTELKNKSALVLPGIKLGSVNGLKLDKGWNLITAADFKNKTALTLTKAVQAQTQGNVSIAQWLNTKSIYNNLQNDKTVIYGNDFSLTSDLSYFLYVDTPVTVSNP